MTGNWWGIYKFINMLRKTSLAFKPSKDGTHSDNAALVSHS